MAKTYQVTVNAAGFTAIVAKTDCNVIAVKENRASGGWPNGDFLVAKPTSSDTAVQQPSGSTYIFQGTLSFSMNPNRFCQFRAGDTVGYLKMVANSTTFDVDEDHA